MAQPLWSIGSSEVILAHTGYHIIPGNPQPRLLTHSVPGVSGTFVGFLGTASRTWSGRGYLEVEVVAGDEEEVMKELKEDILDRQALVGSVIDVFTDSSTVAYTYCIINSYRQAGDIHIEPNGAQGTGDLRARVAVTFEITQLDPS